MELYKFWRYCPLKLAQATEIATFTQECCNIASHPQKPFFLQVAQEKNMEYIFIPIVYEQLNNGMSKDAIRMANQLFHAIS